MNIRLSYGANSESLMLRMTELMNVFRKNCAESVTKSRPRRKKTCQLRMCHDAERENVTNNCGMLSRMIWVGSPDAIRPCVAGPPEKQSSTVDVLQKSTQLFVRVQFDCLVTSHPHRRTCQISFKQCRGRSPLQNAKMPMTKSSNQKTANILTKQLLCMKI